MSRVRLAGLAMAAAITAPVALRSLGPGPQDTPAQYTNSAGLTMIRIRSGAFKMGNDLPTDPAVLKQSPVLNRGDYDERPVHEVRITYDFYMSETEVTAKQYSEFREDYQDWGASSPYATGVSWDDAEAFCEWLSKKEGRRYRLPTEAEWEFAAQAGSTGHFPTGDRPPAAGEPNHWGLKNMNAGPAEWVLDWYGCYPDAPQVDPVGPAEGFAKVVRGGGLNGPSDSKKYPNFGSLPYFRRSANRASIAPQFRGRHNIGFRIVEAPVPTTKPLETAKPLTSLFVHQTNENITAGPDPKKPWFRRRDALPIPPEGATEDEIEDAGLPPGVLGKNHNPALVVCPNGDLLALYFTASVPDFEDLSNVAIAGARLRFGSNEWDMPDVFVDFADTKDIAPALWAEGSTIYFVWGGGGLDGVPFRWTTSIDNGLAWSPVRFPLLSGPLGGYFAQPISRGFRGPDGVLYVPADGIGGESLLWASRDEGRTWSDTGGRTAGRHTVFVVRKDGSVLGIGGKATNIDGYMPKAVSRDGGRTWAVSKTPFPAVGKSQQKPSLIRLASGRLFFASDYQDMNDRQPAGIGRRGGFVALSDDEGETWKLKPLPGALPSIRWVRRNEPGYDPSPLKDGTLGYSIAAQAPNGVIHLITSANLPPQHFEMNEAWILSDATAESAAGAEAGPLLSSRENYPDGRPRARWSGRIDGNGGYVLSGREEWLYPNGRREYQAEWRAGRKFGAEVYWAEDGRKIWEWDHRPDGSAIWTHYDSAGRKRQQSTWRNGRCVGMSMRWDASGKIVSNRHFDENGRSPER